ncbi:Serine/threonine-protein kinase pkn1 [Colletotrichum chlorophyti]|uniref:Serine/threonine-protein kinase pkn1 n=1 Tax=Colletotrichum chlorophyti TaxID=708187 RepID=A0A1Q8S6Y3_9PEZI|nr:Serine/threonine-protein kinase pkn1 [Colletotrichum chlorophyti]
MGNNASASANTTQAPADGFGSEPLLTLPDGRAVDLASGYIPLLVRYTHEDKAAKGLRKRKPGEKPKKPIYFSALELVRDSKILFLTGPSGSGKTTFGKHLSFRLSTTGFSTAQPLVRNEFGDTRDEKWDAGSTSAYYFTVDGPESLKKLVEVTIPGLVGSIADHDSSSEKGLVVLLDTIEKAGSEAPHLLNQVFSLFRASEKQKLVLLGDVGICRRWVFPLDVERHDLLPLLKAQRQRVVSELLGHVPADVTIGTGAAAANPALLALALQAESAGEQAEDLLDTWLSVVYSKPGAAETLASKAYDRISSDKPTNHTVESPSVTPNPTPALYCDAVQGLLAARHLTGLPADDAVKLFRCKPMVSQPIIHSCLVRLSSSGNPDKLVEGLLSGSPSEAQRGALLVADLFAETEKFRNRITSLVLVIVTQGTLSANKREKAGRILSKLGDPRDLTALTKVPAGSFVMGSQSHPNSQPLHSIFVDDFHIGLYPVVNQDYSLFTRNTGREWLSPDGDDPERRNAPATDLTWHDARAYCSWLTARWQTSGRISTREEVRLPTEPEWERAARGDQNVTGDDGLVYPWGTTWRDDAANSEEAGFNTTCAVGLFPSGRSSYGCYDLAGHVWEWCTTLWGEDMANPSFKYPWRDDGREALGAPEPIRRVLRGGCFSSPSLKANCTYRGSLEPSGYWRGNGFRVVVAPVAV